MMRLKNKIFTDPKSSCAICHAAFIVIILFLSFPVRSQEISDFEKFEKEITRHFHSGDDQALFNEVESMLLKNPDHPLATLYYKDLVYLSEVSGTERAEKALTEIISRIKAGNKNPYRFSYLLQATLALQMLYKKHDIKKTNDISDELNFIRKWLLLGPYRKYGPGDMAHPFMPELISDIKKFDTAKQVESERPDGTVDCRDYLFPHQGIAYAVTSFTADNPVKIRIYADTLYRAYINGREVIQNLQESHRDLRIIRISKAKNITLMLKLFSGTSWKFRVIITDDDDRIVRPEIILDKVFHDPFNYSQCEEHPFEYLKSKELQNPVQAFGYLGDYFSDLNSAEALQWYRKSLAIKDDPATKYFYAYTLLHLSEGDKGSAKYLDAWRIFEQLHKDHPASIPFAHKVLQRNINNADYDHAISEGKKILKSAPRYLLAYVDVLRMYSKLGLKKEFFRVLDECTRRFPQSIVPLVMEAEFWNSRDREKYIAVHESILKKEFREDSCRKLLSSFIHNGEYVKASILLESLPAYGIWNDARININLRKGNYAKAKKLIFREIVKRDAPWMSYKLGLIDFFSDMDPSMHWEKMLSLDPSRFLVSDYLEYLKDKNTLNPFGPFALDKENIEAILGSKNLNGDPSAVISRTIVFKLYKDGSSRVFCDDVVRINNQKGVDQWGEYQVPFKGKFQPIHVRVYKSAEDFYDSYDIHKVDYDTYLSINSLEKNTVLHLSYIVDNPVDDPLYSTFLAFPITLLQKYNEPVKRLSCIIIAPDDMPVSLLYNKGSAPVITEDEGIKTYLYSLHDLPAVKDEYYAGSDFNCLPYFAFSTMKDFKDFSLWYNGLIAGSMVLPESAGVAAMKGAWIEDTVRNVYDFVARKITTQKNILFYPARAEDTLFIKRGTPEDKVILAKSILESFGIQSFIAFTPKRFLDDADEFISPAIFSHILLYVPLDAGKGYWFDFSGDHFPCGVVNGSVDNVSALVLLKKGTTWKQITGIQSSMLANDYKVTIHENGVATFHIKAAFGGLYGGMREYFMKSVQKEENISWYFGKSIPSMELGSFATENENDYRNPFIITVKAESPGYSILGKDTVILQPVVNKSSVYNYIRYPRRTHPLWISSPILEKEEYEFTLPVSGAGNGLDKKYSVKNKFGFASLIVKMDKGSRVLRVSKVVDIKPTVIESVDYEEFLNFCLQLKNIETTSLSIQK